LAESDTPARAQQLCEAFHALARLVEVIDRVD
jgi:hypothetical protein